MAVVKLENVSKSWGDFKAVDDFNLTIKEIETRDICIFPSSLFHHTIPFESSEERICFVFDLVQK